MDRWITPLENGKQIPSQKSSQQTEVSEVCEKLDASLSLKEPVAPNKSRQCEQKLALWKHQEELVASVIACKEEGFKRLLVQLPTGGGKTVAFCELARQLDARTLIVVNREELVRQTMNTLRSMGFNMNNVRKFMGKQKTADGEVVVTTMQTASRDSRLAALQKGGDFNLLVVDEAHHCTADTYLKVLRTLGFWEEEAQHQRGNDIDGGSRNDGSDGVGSNRNVAGCESNASAGGASGTVYKPWKLLLGVTATPYRHSGTSLQAVFEHHAFEKSIAELIKEKFLSKVVAERIMTCVDISEVPDSPEDHADHGDFNASELSKVINSDERNELVVKSYLKAAQQEGGRLRKAVAFCCSVQHAEDLAEAFRRADVPVAAVHSKLPEKDRGDILARHKAGELQVLTNVGILTEGYDDPSIDAVLMARPTKSAGLFTQCVGRGLRTHSEKENCLVLEFTDNHHKLDGPSDIVTALDVFPECAGLVTFKNFRNPTNGVVKELKQILQNSPLQLFNDAPNVKLRWVQHANSSSYVLEYRPPNMGRHLIRLRKVLKAEGKRGEVEWQLEHATEYGGPWLPVYMHGPPQQTMGPIAGHRDKFKAALVAAEKKLKNLAEACPKNLWQVTTDSLKWLDTASDGRSKRATDQQLKELARLGAWGEAGNAPADLTKGQATDLITLMNVEKAWQNGATGRLSDPPATSKQVSCIENMRKQYDKEPAIIALFSNPMLVGEHGDPRQLTRRRASRLIQALLQAKPHASTARGSTSSGSGAAGSSSANGSSNTASGSSRPSNS